MKSCFFLSFLLAAPVLAQQEPTLLDEVVVHATSPSLTTPAIEERQRLFHTTPGAVDLVEAETTFKRGLALTLRDALEMAPGVYIQPRFGSDEARVSIRGSGIQRTFHGRGLTLLQDGVPLNLADGGFDFQSLEPLTTDYLEVYRGGNALEFGSATLGGAVNFVSLSGHTAPRIGVRLSLGSFGTAHMQVSSGLVLGPVDTYVSLSHSFRDGFQEHSRQRSQKVFANIGYRVNESVESRFYLTYVNTDSEIPGNLTKEELRQNPRQAQRSAFMKRFDRVDSDWRRDYTLWRIANRTTYQQDDHKLTLGTYWVQKDLDHPILFVIDQFSNDFGVNLRYDNTADLNGHRNRFTLGFQTSWAVMQDNRYQNLLGQRGAKISDNEQLSTHIALFLEDQFYFTDRFAVTVGTQVSYARRKNRDHFPVTLADPDHSDVQQWWGLSPKLGFLYEITERTQAYLNISRSFEPPSFGELTTPALGGTGLVELEAQEATTLEIGTRGHEGRFRWDLAWYYSWIDRELMEYELLPGVTQTVNAGQTIHHGVEAALEIDLFQQIFSKAEAAHDRIYLRTMYLWNDFRFRNDPVYGNNPLPGIPPHYLKAEFVYEHPCGFYIGPNIEWSAVKYNVDSADTLHADPYTLVGFRTGYRSERGLSVFFEARNLLDKRYAATTGVISHATPHNQAQFNPGDGRGFYVGLEWRW